MSGQIEGDRILAEATHTGVLQGGEWHWKPSELPVVFHKAKELKIAAIGGTPRFLLPDGVYVYDLYWISIDSESPTARGKATWEEYVIRSNDERLALLSSQMQTIDFRKQAAEWPEVREQTLDKGIDPLVYLYYGFYFKTKQEFIGLARYVR